MAFTFPANFGLMSVVDPDIGPGILIPEPIWAVTDSTTGSIINNGILSYHYAEYYHLNEKQNKIINVRELNKLLI